MKKKFFALALVTAMVCGCVSTASAADAKLTDGLTGYYTFEDSLANKAGAEGATAKLHNGAGDNWNTAVTDAATFVTGKNGKGLEFLGDNGTVKGVGLELDVKTTDSFTISAWVNTDQKVNFQSIAFVSYDFDSFISVGTQFNDFASGALSLYGGWPHVVATGQAVWLDKNDAESVSTLKDIAVDTWTYVTLTCTADGNMALYYDGKLLADGAISGYDERFSDQYIFMGINFWDASFKGTMDDVAVYNRALSATEVEKLYNQAGDPTYVAPSGGGNGSGSGSGNGGTGSTDTADMAPVVAVVALAAVAAVVVLKKRTVTE